MYGTLKNELLKAVDDFCGLADSKGSVIICTDSKAEGGPAPGFRDLSMKNKGPAEVDGLLYMQVMPDYLNKYYLFIKKTSDESEKILRLLSLFAENYLRQQLEKNNVFYFYKKLLSGMLDENEIHENASMYKIRNEQARGIIIISHGESDYPVSEMITNIFPDFENNIIVEMDSNTVAYIVDILESGGSQVLMELSEKIADTIEEELMVKVKVGIGNVTSNLVQMPAAYENASTAISVGSIFEFETNIFDFNTLGIGKMIYNSDKKVLDDFLRETVSRKTFELLDDEIIKTVLCFFRNNLNISETARRMYLHRNTLVYRIEKVLKLTGLDLRNFDDAVSFKAAYMVKCYIDKINQDD